MPNQTAQILVKGLFPCLLLSNVLLSPVSASPVGTRASAIGPSARQQIRITASVRPTLALRQQFIAGDGNRAICIWSNIPMMKYDVTIGINREMAVPLPHSLKERMSSECSPYNSIASLLKNRETSDDNVQVPSVVTLIIAPY